MDNLSRVRRLLPAHSVTYVIITHVPHVRWACGFRGSNALLLVGQEDAVLYTDGRYETQAQQDCAGVRTVFGADLVGLLGKSADLPSGARIAIDPAKVSLAEFRRLDSRLECTLVEVPELLALDVAIKSPEERDRIVAAQHITEQAFDAFLGCLKPGVTEREMAAEIIALHLQHGADAMSFDPIVASGPNSALPHARPTDRVIQKGDVVLIDVGCFKDGYASDMTRTITIGSPPKLFEDIYDIVLDAQRRATDVVEAGTAASEVDRTAREAIKGAGYAAFFVHSTGHGVGLEIHEPPKVSSQSSAVLQSGMVVTIEPGIYLPGHFGVRIEDMVAVGEGTRQILTNTPKSRIRL